MTRGNSEFTRWQAIAPELKTEVMELLVLEKELSQGQSALEEYVQALEAAIALLGAA